MVSTEGPEDVIKSSVVVIHSLQIKEEDLQEEDNSYVVIILYT